MTSHNLRVRPHYSGLSIGEARGLTVMGRDPDEVVSLAAEALANARLSEEEVVANGDA